MKRKELLLFHVGVFLVLGGIFFGVFAYYYCEVYSLELAEGEGIVVAREAIVRRLPLFEENKTLTEEEIRRIAEFWTYAYVWPTFIADYPLRSYLAIFLSLFVAGVVILTYALWTSGFRAKINIASAEK